MTGFDVPCCSTIYLDKPMRNHTLMQTIARANRVFRDKVNGLIVDYVGVFRDLQKALAIYGTAYGGGIREGETPVLDKNNLLNDLKEAVSIGPVSIAIEADTKEFQLYTSGVLTGDSCGTNLDHGVLIVGYGVENNIEYWLVKNSWGPSWGDQGYIKIERSDSTDDPGVCGIAMQPSYPNV